MADKELTVFVIDVGRSTGFKREHSALTDHEAFMEYVWHKITTMVATGRKTLNGAVIAFRTNTTSNGLQNESGYQNITVLHEPGQITMPDIRSLQEKIKPHNSKHGDPISALVVAMVMISGFCKKLKYKKRIIMVTNGDMLAERDSDNIEQIGTQLEEEAIELTVVGIDVNSFPFGFSSALEKQAKRDNEAVLEKLAIRSNGSLITLSKALAEVETPSIRPIRPVATFKGKLQLGDPEAYDTAIQIDVERYPRTMLAKAPTGSRYVVKSEDDMAIDTNGAHNEAPNDHEPGFQHMLRKYEVKDESAPGGKLEVDRDSLAKGYSYGNSLVHIEQADQNVTKLETKAGLEIIGCVNKDNVQRYMAMSKTSMIVAQRTNNAAMMALSALIHSLSEVDAYAIARLVTKEGRPPVLVLLAPEITQEHECLIDVELPFAEDFRQHKFPPLDRVVTVGGKVLTSHRNLPQPELDSAMAAFVDCMDLTRLKDADNAPIEMHPIDELFSPNLHRLNQAVQHRAAFGGPSLPPASRILTNAQHPPDVLLEDAEAIMHQLAQAAFVKKVPQHQKAKGRGRGREDGRPLSERDLEELLHESNRQPEDNTELRISRDNAIPEFKQAVANPRGFPFFHAAMGQMEKHVRSWIKRSVGDMACARAVEAVGVMREAAVELEDAVPFNAFLRRLKSACLHGELDDGEPNGDRREMWHALRRAHIRPIDNEESPDGGFSPVTSRLFMQLNAMQNGSDIAQLGDEYELTTADGGDNE